METILFIDSGLFRHVRIPVERGMFARGMGSRYHRARRKRIIGVDEKDAYKQQYFVVLLHIGLPFSHRVVLNEW